MPSFQKQQRSLSSKQPQTGHLFVCYLLQWNQHDNTRSMPWKGEKDPYKIWLSEIILQQTRVEQGLKYYQKFISTFPDIHALAVAQPEKVFKLWEGLGYYSRCKNLIASAHYISGELKGKFPEDHASILQLKGVGSYIAAAIASFAYNLPHAVLDGNVYRVLSRICDLDVPIDTAEGKKQFSALAQEILPTGQAAVYNQAIMDFGAVICKPVPLCSRCFFNTNCKAYLRGRQDFLPVKSKKPGIKKRWLTYFATTFQGHILIHQRTANDIWQQLFEFPMIESGNSLENEEQMQLFKKQYGFSTWQLISSHQKEQKLTHQLIQFDLLHVEVSQMRKIADYEWIKFSELDQYAFPKTLQWFIGNRFHDQDQVAGK